MVILSVFVILNGLVILNGFVILSEAKDPYSAHGEILRFAQDDSGSLRMTVVR